MTRVIMIVSVDTFAVMPAFTIPGTYVANLSLTSGGGSSWQLISVGFLCSSMRSTLSHILSVLGPLCLESQAELTRRSATSSSALS